VVKFVTWPPYSRGRIYEQVIQHVTKKNDHITKKYSTYIRLNITTVSGRNTLDCHVNFYIILVT